MSRLNRRQALAALWGTAAVAAAPAVLLQAQARPRSLAPAVEVWKSPSCGCCQDWVKHLESHGFRVKVYDVGNAEARARWKVPEALGSCHTARVGGYAIEGHVPAADIHRLLKERPEAIGLAVSGMPIGSPGMDGPEYGRRQDPYDVLLIRLDGDTRVFSSYFSRKD